MSSLTSKTVSSLVDEVVKHTMTTGLHLHKNDPSRANYLRVSSLPFCSRQFFLNVFDSLQPRRHNATSMMYFVTVGTAVHEVIQESLAFSVSGAIADHEIRALPHKAVLVQNWKCKDCGQLHRFVPRPASCSHCGAPESKMLGKEHQVRWGRKVLGHMDGTFAFPSPAAPKAPYSKDWIHIPIDYKTTTLSAIAGKALPYADNATQLSTYGAIKKSEGYNVPFTALIYVSRDNPHRRKVCTVPLNAKAVLKDLALYEDQYLATWDVIRKPDVASALSLPPIVTSKFSDSCGYCKFIDLCEQASKKNLTPLKQQITSRVVWLTSEGYKRCNHFPTD